MHMACPWRHVFPLAVFLMTIVFMFAMLGSFHAHPFECFHWYLGGNPMNQFWVSS
jgi:hypothetical protein